MPEEKKECLKQLILKWKDKCSCTKGELLSLYEALHPACEVVKPGQFFLRRIIELLEKNHLCICLSTSFHSDLEWWATFLPVWNGVGMLSTLCRQRLTVTSDASSWGCGAFSSSGQWFQFAWPDNWSSVPIATKELLPIVMSCALWGHRWNGESVLAYTDNTTVVTIVNSGKSKDRLTMELLRYLFFLSASCGFSLRATHVEGKQNKAADTLSRYRVDDFSQLVSNADPHPTPIPPYLVELLVTNKPNWTSIKWRKLLMSSLSENWPTLLRRPI